MADLHIEKIMPAADEDLAKWTECRFPEYEFHWKDLCYDYDTVPADPSWGGDPYRWTYKVPLTWEPPPADYWMASVYSPALTRPPEDPYYPFPALHAVVFRGDKLAHDPNPQYGPEDQKGYSVVLRQTWWTRR